MPALPIFAFPPDTQAYAVNGGSEVVSTQLEGGMGVYRRDKLGASSVATVQFTCDPLRYEYCRAFYRKTVEMGSLPFQAALIFDAPHPSNYKCYFTEKSGFQIMSQTGHVYVVGTTLEIVTLDTFDPSFDDSLVMLYNTYGPMSPDVLDKFTQIITALGIVY